MLAVKPSGKGRGRAVGLNEEGRPQEDLRNYFCMVHRGHIRSALILSSLATVTACGTVTVTGTKFICEPKHN